MIDNWLEYVIMILLFGVLIRYICYEMFFLCVCVCFVFIFWYVVYEVNKYCLINGIV